jgi:hypothetical protein
MHGAALGGETADAGHDADGGDGDLFTRKGEAGGVIESFGHFVIQGNYVVGFVVFIILVLINFVVITKDRKNTRIFGLRNILIRNLNTSLLLLIKPSMLKTVMVCQTY